MVTAKKYVLKHEVEKVLSSDLVLVEEELPPLKDGGKIIHQSVWYRVINVNFEYTAAE